MFARSLAAVAAAIVAAPVLAQAAPAEPFNGPFAGVELGWQRDKADTRFTSGSTVTTETGGVSGLRYGGFIGYDARVGTGGVVGLEVNASDSTASADDEDGVGKIGRTFDVTARAGALVTPTTLLYARGGYSNTRYIADIGNAEFGVNRDGYILGAGLETMLGTNASARVEYNYSDYKSFELNDGFERINANPKRHVVKAGLAFRF
jgi:outer membrane immunogenic protein